MRVLLTILLFAITSPTFAQFTIEGAKEAARNYSYMSYSYHDQFIGHEGYGAPLIFTDDEGLAFFGKGYYGLVHLVKLDALGNHAWEYDIKPKHDEIETQSVLQDRDGNYYAFMLSYNRSKYRGGAERVISLTRGGSLRWEIMLGGYSAEGSPHCSYIKLLEDGRIELRGHVGKIIEQGKDPEYYFWTGWLNSDGELTQEIGPEIDWSSSAWKEFTKVE